MKLASLFDGIGGFPLSAQSLGIIPVWASEIEKFCIKVTETRFPTMKHYGSVCDINGAEVEPVDIISFGSPCQDLSVAGKRAGLDGARSGLFLEAIRIIKEMRYATNGAFPRYAIWENVPGAFSSNAGHDFRTVIEQFAKIKDESFSIPKPEKWEYAGMVEGDTFSIAWRTLDAQFWGVPQRRRRIFLVADFAGQCAGKIFIEHEGVSGNIEAGREARKEVAAGVGNGIEESSGGVLNTIDRPAICYDARGNGKGDICPKITGDHQNRITDYTAIVLNDQGGQSISVDYDKSPTLRSQAHGNQPCVITSKQPITFSVGNLKRDADANPDNSGFCKTLRAEMGDQHPCIIDVSPTVTTKWAKGTGGPAGDECQNLVVMKDENCVANTMRTGGRGSTTPKHNWDTYFIKNKARRLTPLECERLQGFPDEWTNIPGASDTARYKALGNSVAIPCVKFILGSLL